MSTYFNFKSEAEKNNIKKWITEKQIICESLNIENLVDIISCCKTNLNEEITYCLGLKNTNKNSNLFSSLIESKNRKIDNLIDLYNNSNSYNKINFVDNNIDFSKTSYIKKVKIEFENFNYELPLSYKMRVYTYDNIISEYNILPYNYYGLYSEFFDEGKSESIFKVANKNTIYIYNCIYNENGFQLGKELKLNYNHEYCFKNDYLILDRELIQDKQLLIKYQPGENSFEFELNKKIVKIELEAVDDKMNFDKNIKKKLVILYE